MKKRLLALGIVFSLSLSMLIGCGSKTTETTSESESSSTEASTEDSNGEYQFVSPEDTVSFAKDKTGHVLDVREWDNYVAGRVNNSEWCPIFPLEDEALADEMEAYAKDNLSDGKDIYIICNSGQKGAQKTTEVLEKAGIDSSKIYTVEGGAKALGSVKGALSTERADNEGIEWQYVSAADALEAVGKDDVQILDVRDEDTYKEGHLADSLNCSMKEIEDADAQTAMFTFGTEKLDKEKPIYFLCYSGNKCAKTAISVLKDAGFSLDNMSIIEGGAKDKDIAAALVKD